MRLFDLKGKVAVITGGNGGIGLGMATGLAEAGADIVIAARDPNKSATACDALRKLGIRSEFIPFDVMSEASCRSMIAEAQKTFGRVDILVNNAGVARIGPSGPPEETTIENFGSVLNANLAGPLACAQAAYPHMKQAGGGKIINVASVAAFLTNSMMTAYAPSKAGLVQLTRVLASAWAKDNIQVNSVLPGWITTEMTRPLAQTGFATKLLERTPAGRWGQPEDFSGIAVYLASRASDFVTGSAMLVDGGYSFSQPSRDA
jgi:2-deoxy-D-gluconate 3-dehydrogenase